MPNYRGTKRINDVLEYRGLEEHIQRMEGFEPIFIEEASAAMEDAVGLASARAKENAPVDKGELKGSIFGKMLPVLRPSLTVRGSIGSPLGLKAFVNEVGRWRGSGQNRRFWKGEFYLYYGAQDKAKEIMALYEAANARILQRLVVKS